MLRALSSLFLCLALSGVAEAQLTPLDEANSSTAAASVVPAPPPGYLGRRSSPPRRRHHRPPDTGGWPRLFVLSADFVLASVDFAQADFTDSHELRQIRGEALRLGRHRAPGASVSMRLAPTRFMDLGVDIGFLAPRIGTPGVVMTPGRELVSVRSAHVAYWHGELNLVARHAGFALSAGMRAGWSRTVLELDGDGPATMRAARASAGPHVDVRAHVYRSLFLHVGGFVDMLAWPDAQLEAGFGLARR